MSFENQLATKLNSFKSFSLLNPFLDDNQDELDDEEDDLILNKKDNNKKLTNDNLTDLTEEERKKRADKLWADLMELDKKPVKKESSSELNNSIKTQQNLSSNNSSSTNTLSNNNSSTTTKTIVTKIYDFAGEKVEIKEEIDNKLNTSSSSKLNPLKRGLGINNLVANLGKKQKLSTLNKTKQDWDLFKKEEGIEDDLKKAKKDKNSFVERQAFLQRSDFKQFELEKSVRDKNRSRNQF